MKPMQVSPPKSQQYSFNSIPIVPCLAAAVYISFAFWAVECRQGGLHQWQWAQVEVRNLVANVLVGIEVCGVGTAERGRRRVEPTNVVHEFWCTREWEDCSDSAGLHMWWWQWWGRWGSAQPFSSLCICCLCNDSNSWDTEIESVLLFLFLL